MKKIVKEAVLFILLALLMIIGGVFMSGCSTPDPDVTALLTQRDSLKQVVKQDSITIEAQMRLIRDLSNQIERELIKDGLL